MSVTEEPADDPARVPAPSPVTVLLLVPGHALRRSVRVLLGEHGFTVHAASGLAEAAKLLQSTSDYRLLIVDTDSGVLPHSGAADLVTLRPGLPVLPVSFADGFRVAGAVHGSDIGDPLVVAVIGALASHS